MLLARIAKKKCNLGGRGGDGRSEVPPGRVTLCCTYCGRGGDGRSEVPPGRKTSRCTYCGRGETVDAQH